MYKRQEKYPEKVNAIYDAGHELGNHTATHPHMNKLSAAQMQKEIEDFEAMMVKITGEKTKVFRAPYGEYNDSVITTVRSLGYEVLQWDLDTVDMKWKPGICLLPTACSTIRHRVRYNRLSFKS